MAPEGADVGALRHEKQRNIVGEAAASPSAPVAAGGGGGRENVGLPEELCKFVVGRNTILNNNINESYSQSEYLSLRLVSVRLWPWSQRIYWGF